jgi:hypothetical protein
MGQEIVNRNFTTLWSAPPLPEQLQDALALIRATRPALDEMPLVDAQTRAALPALAAGFDAGLEGNDNPELIEALVARYAADVEAGMKLDIYVEALLDIPEDILRDAFRQAVKEHTFFPTVKEIRDLCAREMSRRRWHATALRNLARRFDNAPEARTDLLPPDEAQRLLAGLAKKIGRTLRTADANEGTGTAPAHA